MRCWPGLGYTSPSPPDQLQQIRSLQRERRISLALQEASLPRTLPVVDGLIFSAAYQPGNSEATIGGDWYDVFELRDGRVAFTLGDVLGNGLQAAVTMAKLRGGRCPDGRSTLEIQSGIRRRRQPDHLFGARR
ncbi:MAG: hypothetical protein NVSMB21_25960 [Vulcanimicrobiaceae bacterium]